MAHNVTLIDREEEPAFLEEAYAQSKSQFIILYGRRTGQWKVKPLDFENALKFFPKNASVKEAVRIYAITGGVPFYLAELDSGKTATENILERIAKKGIFCNICLQDRRQRRSQEKWLSYLGPG